MPCSPPAAASNANRRELKGGSSILHVRQIAKTEEKSRGSELLETDQSMTLLLLAFVLWLSSPGGLGTPGGIGGDRWGHGGANFALIALFRIRLALFTLTFLLARSLS